MSDSYAKYPPKTDWGPPGWYWLHTLAINYPAHPKRQDKIAVYSRLWSFIQSLPCPECRLHAFKYAQKYPPDLTDSERFQTWAWRFHNAVDARLGKPLMSAEDYRDKYSEEMNKTYWKLV